MAGVVILDWFWMDSGVTYSKFNQFFEHLGVFFLKKKNPLKMHEWVLCYKSTHLINVVIYITKDPPILSLHSVIMWFAQVLDNDHSAQSIICQYNSVNKSEFCSVQKKSCELPLEFCYRYFCSVVDVICEMVWTDYWHPCAGIAVYTYHSWVQAPEIQSEKCLRFFRT